MTGFGIARGKVGRFHIVVEARSVNHRYCEVNLRCPTRYALLEAELTRRVREKFSRGKFDLFLKEEGLDREAVEVDLAKRSHRVLKRIQAELGLKGPVTIADVLTCREAFFSHGIHDDAEAMRRPILRLFDQAFDGLETMREREGAGLCRWIRTRLKTLMRLLASIEVESGKRGGEYRRRLESKWQAVGIEEQRLLQESAMMAERADVTEEIVRLRSHLKEFDRQIRQVSKSQSVGRKLDFLAQEMGREINTIGSKSQGVRIVHQVIEFKSELERVREQIQNVE